MKNLKYISDKENLLIEANKSEHPTAPLVTNLHKPTGEENLYVRFGYIPQTIFNHTPGQVSLIINDDSINSNKQVNH